MAAGPDLRSPLHLQRIEWVAEHCPVVELRERGGLFLIAAAAESLGGIRTSTVQLPHIMEMIPRWRSHMMNAATP